MPTVRPYRVAAVPWAAYCINCQETVDRESLSPEQAGDELQLV